MSYPDLKPVLFDSYSDRPGSEPLEFALKGHTSTCYTAEMSPTGRKCLEQRHLYYVPARPAANSHVIGYLITGGGDSVLAIWDTSKWICQRTVTGPVGPAGPIRSISRPLPSSATRRKTGPSNACLPGFTWDGSYFVAGSDEGEFQLLPPAMFAAAGRLMRTQVRGWISSTRRPETSPTPSRRAGPCPMVAWAPTRYCLAYSDLGILRIVGVDTDRK